MKWAKRTGFTIVELLIVIVVIAILAAITVVSYSGIQQSANNTAIIDAASKSKRMIEAYIAANGSYPYTVDEYVCITTDTTCRRNSGAQGVTPAFDAAMATIGSLPRSTPLVSSVRGGVMYNYAPARTVDGISAPATVSYYLFGINTNCGLPVLNTDNNTALTASAGYTIGNVGGSGGTYCLVSISGPAAP